MKYPDLSFEPFFAWSNRPRVMYKAGLREELGFEMEKLGGTKVVIYTDKGLVQAGVTGMAIEAIKSSNLKLVGVYDKIVQDARLDLISLLPEMRRRLHGGRGRGQRHGYRQGHQYPDWWRSR